MSLLLAVDCILVNSVVTCDSWFLGFVFVDLLSGCGISGGCLIVICDCFCLFVGVCDFVVTHWLWLCGLLVGMFVFSRFGKCWCFVNLVCVW